MGRNSVRPVPQEPPILVVTQALLRRLRSPTPAVVWPLLPPHGAGSRPFIGEEHPTGSPDGHTRHARQPATAAVHEAQLTAATSGRRPQTPTGGRRPQTPTGGRRPLTDGRPPHTPPTGRRRPHPRRAAAAHTTTGGRRTHHRRAGAAHTFDGRPPPTPQRAAASHTTDRRSRPTQTTGGSRPHTNDGRQSPEKRARATRFDPCVARAAAAQRLPARQPRPQKERPGCGGEQRRGQGDGDGINHSSHKARKRNRAPESIPDNGTTTYRRPLGPGPPRKKARAKKVRARQRAASQTSAVAQVSRNRPPEALARRRGSRTPLRTPITTSARAWARCATRATSHTPSATQSRGWPARGRTQS